VVLSYWSSLKEKTPVTKSYQKLKCKQQHKTPLHFISAPCYAQSAYKTTTVHLVEIYYFHFSSFLKGDSWPRTETTWKDICLRNKQRKGKIWWLHTLPVQTDKQKRYLYQEVGRIEKVRSSEGRSITSGWQWLTIYTFTKRTIYACKGWKSTLFKGISGMMEVTFWLGSGYGILLMVTVQQFRPKGAIFPKTYSPLAMTHKECNKKRQRESSPSIFMRSILV